MDSLCIAQKPMLYKGGKHICLSTINMYRCVPNASGYSKAYEIMYWHRYLGISSNLQISSHDCLGSQVAGFSWGLSRPTPPVNKNLHCVSSITLSCFSRFTHSSSEKSNCNQNKYSLYSISKYAYHHCEVLVSACGNMAHWTAKLIEAST